MRRTSRDQPGASRAARTSPRSGRGTTDCQRGRIAHSASASSPIAPIAPSGPPSAVPFGLDASRMCGASRTRPVIATRRCQIAARSIPSNHSSTQGSVLIRTSADRQQQDRLGAEQLPDVGAGRLAGRLSDQEQRESDDSATIDAGPTSRATNCGRRSQGLRPYTREIRPRRAGNAASYCGWRREIRARAACRPTELSRRRRRG